MFKYRGHYLWQVLLNENAFELESYKDLSECMDLQIKKEISSNKKSKSVSLK